MLHAEGAGANGDQGFDTRGRVSAGPMRVVPGTWTRQDRTSTCWMSGLRRNSIAYIPLVLDPEPGPRVKNLIRRLEDHYARDVHAMLRLPTPAVDTTPGCNFAIAQVLAPVVSGVSVTLYQHRGSAGALFRGLLIVYYPWSEEPSPPPNKSEAARSIYTLVRNPLTHDLGLDLEAKSRTQRVVVKRLLTNHKSCGPTEQGVGALEGECRLRRMPPAIRVQGDRVVLLVEAFYWGISKLLLNLNLDRRRMAAAEAFLESVDRP